MRRALLMLAALLAAFGGPQPALADRVIGSSLATQPDLPMDIKCAAALENTSVGNVDYYLEMFVAFRNNSQKTASNVEFRFDVLDGFGTVLGTRTGEMDGEYSPGVSIMPKRNMIGTPQPAFSTINIWPSAVSVRCSVLRIRYADGTLWVESAPQPDAPTSVGAGDATRSCNRAWIAQDWSTVAADCASSADAFEAAAKTAVAASQADTGTDALQQIDAAGKADYGAGEAQARVAAAFAKLKRGSLALSAQNQAVADLKDAEQYLQSQNDKNRAAALESFIDESDFFKKAADSDLLVHI